MKATCFVSDSPRLGRRKILINGAASRDIMRAHLHAAYIGGAAENYGAGFLMRQTDNALDKEKSFELGGEYIGIFFDQDAPQDCERQIAERINVRRAAFWERIT